MNIHDIPDEVKREALALLPKFFASHEEDAWYSVGEYDVNIWEDFDDGETESFLYLTIYPTVIDRHGQRGTNTPRAVGIIRNQSYDGPEERYRLARDFFPVPLELTDRFTLSSQPFCMTRNTWQALHPGTNSFSRYRHVDGTAIFQFGNAKQMQEWCGRNTRFVSCDLCPHPQVTPDMVLV